MRLDELEAWADKSTEECLRLGFMPGRVPEMRKRLTTKGAMERLVQRPEPERTPLARLIKAGLRIWTIESGVLMFPDIFDDKYLQAAAWQIRQACGEE